MIVIRTTFANEQGARLTRVTYHELNLVVFRTGKGPELYLFLGGSALSWFVTGQLLLPTLVAIGMGWSVAAMKTKGCILLPECDV